MFRTLFTHRPLSRFIGIVRDAKNAEKYSLGRIALNPA